MIAFIVNLLVLLFTLASAEKSCWDTYDEIECLNDARYMVCNYDYDTRKYNQKIVSCPKNTKCDCWVGEGCSAEEMCREKIQPKPFIDTGMLSWVTKVTYDCSGCAEIYSYSLEKGFVYKLPNGRFFKEVLSKSSWLKTTRVLLIPRPDGNGFDKYNSINNKCSKSVVSSSDALMHFNLDGYRMTSSPTERKQTWRKEKNNLGNAHETKWTVTAKEYDGKLVPISSTYDESSDGLGDGESEWRKTRFTYHPKVVEKRFMQIKAREEKLMKSCQ